MKRLPERNWDLERYVRRRLTMRILLCAAWSLVLISGAVFYNRMHQTYTPDRLILGWKLAVWILFSLFSGALIFRLPGMLFDRSFEGVILSSGIAHSYSSSPDPGAGSAVDYSFRLNTALRVQTADGKIKRIRFEQKSGFYQYYREGTFVRHYAGLPYPLAKIAGDEPKQPRSGRDSHEDRPLGNYLCVACGRLHPTPGFCDVCHHTIIDPKDVF